MKRSNDKRVTAIVSIRIDENSAGFADAPIVRRELDNISGVNGVIFDLYGVRVVASGIIGVIIGQMNRTNVALVVTTNELKKMIQIMSLENIIPIFDYVEPAYEYLTMLDNNGARQHDNIGTN